MKNFLLLFHKETHLDFVKYGGTSIPIAVDLFHLDEDFFSEQMFDSICEGKLQYELISNDKI